ncbi:MAG: hypothetical protein V1882_12860 [Candidatus Omnitrophota bacterium]
METESFKTRPGLRGGYGYVRCPNSECEHILFEVSKKFWHTNRIEKIPCPDCGRFAALFACLQSENDAGELIVRYWCRHCQKSFEKTMIGVRKYCSGCRTYQNIYFSLSLVLSGEIPGKQEAAAET